MPSVVHITTQGGGAGDFLVPQGVGSGVIVSDQGHVLTNNHVAELAGERGRALRVRLSDGKEVAAKIVGTDSESDLALLKIDAPKDVRLVPIAFANSDKVRVGDWCLAIGSPFGYNHTVTAGIVSAMGRHINQGPYDNFIQTDAAINPGNSGGPLLNTRGEVVGINTAIFSRGGGNIGIGFAIPIDLAKEIVPQLKEKGHVTRGWLGVMIQKVTPDIAESLGLSEAKGALVADVVKDGPAEAAGIKQGDVIIEYDGKPVGDSAELPLLVARTPVGKSVKVKLLRGKETETVTVKVQELKEEEAAQAGGGTAEDLGMTVQTLTPEIAENLGIDRGLKGVVVTQVDPGGAASDAGLRRGDVILEVNRQPVATVDAFRDAAHAAGNRALLLVYRNGVAIYVTLSR